LRSTHTLAVSRRFLGVAALLAVAMLAIWPAAGQAAGIDGPGSYYMFRSFDTGVPFTPDQRQACVDHYGARPWSPLNAGLFGFTGDAHGRIVDQKASYLGAATACTSPSPTPGLLELFGTTWPPGSPIAGLTSFTSQCAPSPAPTPGVLLVNCRASLGPDAASRVAGGFVASNTVSNPRNLPGAPTGSLWTTYVLRDGGIPLAAPAGGVPVATPAPSPGLDFYVFRTMRDRTATRTDCTAGDVSTRSSALYATAPQLADGELPQGLGPQQGSLVICFTGAGAASRPAAGHIELTRGGTTLQLAVSGDCAEYATPVKSELRQQACSLRITPTADQLAAGIRGGLLTSIGLVEADEPLEPANSHIWSLALWASAA
jgi:hypothetical protein